MKIVRFYKKSRINSALAKIRVERAKNDQIVETPLYDFFSTQENENADNDVKVIPDFCRKPLKPRSKSNKLPCIQSSILCSYSIEMFFIQLNQFLKMTLSKSWSYVDILRLGKLKIKTPPIEIKQKLKLLEN